MYQLCATSTRKGACVLLKVHAVKIEQGLMSKDFLKVFRKEFGEGLKSIMKSFSFEGNAASVAQHPFCFSF